MSQIRQADLALYHMFVGSIVIDSTAETKAIIPIPQSGTLKRVSAVAHGGGLDGNTVLTFEVGGVAQAGEPAGSITLLASDAAGVVRIANFDPPTAAAKQATVREGEDGDAGLTSLNSCALEIISDGGTTASETFSLVVTLSQK